MGWPGKEKETGIEGSGLRRAKCQPAKRAGMDAATGHGLEERKGHCTRLKASRSMARAGKATLYARMDARLQRFLSQVPAHD